MIGELPDEVSLTRPPSRGLKGRRAPDFFIVGQAKCGTTALYQMLAQHPEIFVPDFKEPTFLASDMRCRFAPPKSASPPETMDDYLALFDKARSDQQVGEASTLYLTSSTAAPAIAALNGDARIIGIFREPAAFLCSLHLQHLKVHVEDERDLRRALQLEGPRRDGRHIPRRSWRPQVLQYSEHVRYREQLQRYHAVLPPQQILVLLYDDFRRDNDAAVRRVFRFLGVDDSVPIRPVQANPSVSVRSQSLDSAVHRVSVGGGPLSRPVKTALKALMPREVRRRLLHQVQSHLIDSHPPAPDEALMAELRDWLRPEVERFGEYLGRDLLGLWGYDD